MPTPLDDAASYLFTNDDPGPYDRGPDRTPEWWLCYAVMKDVVDVLHSKYGPWHKRRQYVRDALRWIRDPWEDAEWHFTFKEVCRVLELDSSNIRKALVATAKQQFKQLEVRGDSGTVTELDEWLKEGPHDDASVNKG